MVVDGGAFCVASTSTAGLDVGVKTVGGIIYAYRTPVTTDADNSPAAADAESIVSMAGQQTGEATSSPVRQ